MKIGILVEGRAEYSDLHVIISKNTYNNNKILKPLFAPMQPKASAMQIARSAKAGIGILINQGVDKIIVLIDKEDQDFCIIKHAKEIKNALNNFCNKVSIEVIIKNKQFENWLIADINNLQSIKGFKLSESFISKISKDKADNQQNPVELLESIMTIRRTYDKGIHGKRIVSNIDTLKIAENSRSFRKFLRELGHSDYLYQSKKPVIK